LGHPFRCFIGQVIPTAVHFTILIVLVLLGKDPTLRYMGYTLLTGVALSTLYLIAKLHLCCYSAPGKPGALPHAVLISKSTPCPENMDSEADVTVQRSHRQREVVSDVF